MPGARHAERRHRPVAKAAPTVAESGVTRILSSPAARERYAAAGADIGTGSAQDFAGLLAAGRTKWSKLIREANIQAE